MENTIPLPSLSAQIPPFPLCGRLGVQKARHLFFHLLWKCLVFRMLSYWLAPWSRQDRCNYPYFAGEKTEAQRGKETVQMVAAYPSRGLWSEWSL